ncbi:MAG: efflux RND transporter periplasmic adaptor subunit [Vicinamibacterales bacterium]
MPARPDRPRTTRRAVRAGAALVLAVLVAACGSGVETTSQAAARTPAEADAAPTGAVRFSGTVEAVRSRAVSVPRLRGTYTPMVITYLVKAGTRVEPGDLLVEFDPQEQERLALDSRAEIVDLDGQIAKKVADQRAAQAKDQTELKQAEHDVERAQLAVRTNELVARVEAEKNTLALEQANARLAQLQETYKLKREAEAADLQILQIRRDRAARALDYAERNAELMRIEAPFAGLVVIKTTYKGQSGFAPYVEGDEVRPGLPIIDIVDTSAMQVRAKVNQADDELVEAGMPAVVRLDGFPQLRFDGRVESVTPLATPSQFSPLVRTFVAVVSIDGVDEQLLPDLTASVEIVPGAAPRPAPAPTGGQ